MHGSGDKKCFNSIRFHKSYRAMIKWIPVLPFSVCFPYYIYFKYMRVFLT